MRTALFLIACLVQLASWCGGAVEAQPALSAEGSRAPATLEGGRLPVPSQTVQERASAKVRAVFADEAAGARTPEARSSLGSRLLAVAADERDPAAVYVLLDAAISFFMEAGDVTRSLEALDQQTKMFAIDARQRRIDVLKATAKTASAGDAGKVADLLIREADRLGRDEDFKGAVALMTMAQATARRSRDVAVQKAVAAALAGLRKQEKQAAATAPVSARVRALESRLAVDPNDSEATGELGRIMCFDQQDWQSGLPLVARGSDAELAALAKADLAASSEPAARMQLGSMWVAAAKKMGRNESQAAEARAREHYIAAAADLTGLERARVDKLIAELTSRDDAHARRPESLILWLDAAQKATLRTVTPGPGNQAGAADAGVIGWSDPARNMTFTVASNARPPTITNDKRKKPGVVFAGKSWMTAEWDLPPAGTLFVVFRPATLKVLQRVIGAPPDDPGIHVAIRPAPENVFWFGIFKNRANASLCRPPMKHAVEGSPVLLVGCWPEPFYVRINGFQFLAREQCTAGTNGRRAMVLGASHQGGAEPFQGDVHEIRVYNKVLLAEEVVAIERELNSKWLH